MSVKYEKFLQEQINSLDIEVAQLKGLVKALLDSAREINERIEDMDSRIPLYKGDSHE
jgi:septal ring factor EnvC (AmiA/AmiB activator)